MRVRMLAAVAAALFAAAAQAADVKAKYPPLPEAFSSFGAAVCDGSVYVYGGHVGKTHQYSTEAVTGKFRRLNLADPSKGWEELPGEVGIQGLALVAHGGKLYRIGGMAPRNKPGEKADNHSLSDCARFDPAAGKWEPLPPLPEPRSSHDAAVVGDKIVVVGGWRLNGAGKETTWHDTTLVMDLGKAQPKWGSVPQPFKRRALTATAHRGKVHVFCGMSDESRTELTVNVFDPATGKWAAGPAVPGPRRNGFSPASCSDGTDLYVSPADGKVLRLRDGGDGWDEVGALKQPRIVHRLVSTGSNRLLALGGASKGGNVALTEAVVPRAKAESRQ